MRGRRAAGQVLAGLGVLLIAGALALFCHNWREAAAADRISGETMAALAAKIEAQTAGKDADPNGDMDTLDIDGEAYIGFLTIPDLDLELPVMGQWSYEGLRVAPGRYYGTVQERNLVIAAHNYPHHFGRLKELHVGDEVIFTDVHGQMYRYMVGDLEILPPTAMEEMTTGEYDLSLFTCSYGGRTRFTVRCMREQ